jgi:gamma-glutamylcyclotransferase (GGCT)/AIG2-like uncharacterized protein YtfP
MSVKVFCYGTLRTGDVRHGVPSFIEMLTPEAYIDGFVMLDLGGFPGLIEGDGRVRGEVHEYENLETLDRIEGYSEASPDQGLYNRVQVPVFHDDGGVAADDVWVYTFNGDPCLGEDKIIGSGDWFQHRGYYEELEGAV